MAIKQLPKIYSPDFRLPSKKPVGDVEIDWSNPLSRGLSLVLVGNKLKPINLVNSSFLTINGNVTHNPSLGWVFGNTTADYISDSSLEYGVTGDFSSYIVTNAAQDSSGGFPTFIARGDSKADEWMIRHKENGDLGFYGDAAAWNVTSSTGILKYGVQQTVGFSLQGSGGEVNIYIEGNNVGSDTGGNLSTGSTKPLTIGAADADPNRPFKGSMSLIVMYNRILSDAEHRSLSKKPYQILKPKSAPVYFTADGGGGPVTQFITVEPITSGEAFGTATLAAGLVTITAIGIASEEAVGDVNLASGATLLTPESTASQEALGEPDLLVGTKVLEPTSITTEEALGLVSLLSQNVVLVSSITSEEILGNPELAYDQVLSVVSAHTGETIGNAKVLGGTVGLALNTVYRDVMSDVYRITMRDGYDIRT